MKTTFRYWIFALLLLGLAGYSHADNPGSTQDCAIATQQIALDGGVLHYNRAGAGSPILLLHGLFAQKEQWNSLLCLLSAAGYTAIAPDLPGYGQSVDFPLADYRLEHQVARLRQLIDILGITRFELAGSSMGGAIAALYVRTYPDQVHTLAFIGSPLGLVDWSPQVKEAIYQGINPFIPVDIAQFDLEMSLLFANPPQIPQPVKEAAVKDYVEHNRHYQQVWDIVNLYDTLLDQGPRLRIPTLVIWGANDKVFNVQDAERLHYRIPRSKRVKLPNTGHLPHLENPAKTAAIYIGFLQSRHGGWFWEQ